ncbi:hypothetical protein [Streptomyces hokutonensis]|uniref:hypothetical protein n=1 Tax=Streptomyces hokutonensis TaxID=1306990 RepID=UPI003402D487
MALHLASTGYTVDAVDWSDTALEHARATSPADVRRLCTPSHVRVPRRRHPRPARPRESVARGRLDRGDHPAARQHPGRGDARREWHPPHTLGLMGQSPGGSAGGAV